MKQQHSANAVSVPPLGSANLDVVPLARKDVNCHHQQQQIKAVYDRLVTFTEGTGRSLSFVLSSFVTVPETRFTSVGWLDLISLPSERALTIIRRILTGHDEVEYAQYIPAWEQVRSHVLRPMAHSLMAVSVADVVASSPGRDPVYADVTSATSYQVEVTLDRRLEHYRAVAFWHEVPDRAPRLRHLVDLITPRLEDVMGERRPRLGRLSAVLADPRLL